MVVMDEVVRRPRPILPGIELHSEKHRSVRKQLHRPRMVPPNQTRHAHSKNFRQHILRVLPKRRLHIHQGCHYRVPGGDVVREDFHFAGFEDESRRHSNDVVILGASHVVGHESKPGK